jgi:hypothetical protein
MALRWGDGMTALEIIALIFIAFFIIKIAMLLAMPKAWAEGPGKQLSGNQAVSYAFNIIAGALLLYFLLKELSIVQVFVAAMLGTLITMITLTPYTPSLLREIGAGEGLLRKTWLGTLVTVVLMAWVLWDIFR